MFKQEVTTSSFVVNQDCELNINAPSCNLTFEKGVKYCFISQMTSCQLNILVKGEIDLIFLHKNSDQKSEVKIELINKNARVNAREITLVNHQEKFDKKIEIIHQEKETFSDYLFLGFALGNSSLNIAAKSKIPKGKSKSEARQILKIMTDENGKAQGQPGLFIDDFDVRASHGNSIGQIDRRQIYYLQTKGISYKEAWWMVIEGYIKTVLKGVEEERKAFLINELRNELIK